MSYYKQQSPYETAKKSLWSNKMAKSMPLWTDLTARVGAKLMQTSNKNLRKKPTALDEIFQMCNNYKLEVLVLDDTFYTSLSIAMIFDQAGKAGYDLDEFKEIVEQYSEVKPKKKTTPKKKVTKKKSKKVKSKK